MAATEKTELIRRQAAILMADIAGYSRLMASDGPGTVAALDTARAAFREQIAARRGQVVDTACDSVLAVFDDASAASWAQPAACFTATRRWSICGAALPTRRAKRDGAKTRAGAGKEGRGFRL